ncbi:MAG: D-alanyl-D-alanine carboxypeptidase [Alphaproteobacteria bacterium]|nr:D-alanyl-D-alanine carboxypeptidase [Alphaproteobacteria bacterium]
MKRLILGGLLTVLSATTCLSAPVFDTMASHAYLVDYDTGAVLLDKNSDDLMAPASMSKLMTVYILFEKIKRGEISLDDKFEVSTNAWKKGGEKSGSSTMFLKPNSKVKVSELIKGIIIQSGNDACITVAENIAGSEENFAEEMTLRAREIGMEKSTFKNATGWPNKEHLMTSKELAMLAQKLISEFPDFYPIFSEKSFKYNGIKQDNRNPLLYSMPDQADGLKTGHTEKSGYALVGSAKSKDGKRRLILVVNGLKSMKDRNTETKKIMEWGLREFENYTLFKDGKVVTDIPVWLGMQESVPVVLEKDVLVTIHRLDKPKTKVTVTYDSWAKAPVKKGDLVASLNIVLPDGKSYRFPLVAAKDVGKINFLGRMKLAVSSLLYGKKDE